MAFRHRAAGILACLGAVALAGSCSRDAAAIDLVLKAPAGMLDSAERVVLHVFDADLATCGPDGHISHLPASGERMTFELERCGGPGVTWCKDIELDRGDEPILFVVIASDATGILGEGCTTATVDQDPLEVAIKLKRYNPPPCCNDGVVQAGEQCDPPQASTPGVCAGVTESLSCAADCTAKEIALDRAEGEPPPAPASKSQLALAFCPGSGERDGALRAAFTDQSPAAKGGSDVQLRMLRHDFELFTTDPGVANAPGRMPLLCSAPGASGLTRLQRSPAIAALSQSSTAVVFLSDSDPDNPGSLFEVFLSRQNGQGCAPEAPIQVNRTPRIARSPDVAAGPGDAALIVWSTIDDRVLGRIWRSDTDTFFPESDDLHLADDGIVARVAGNESGWRVVYQGAGPGDGTGIFLRTVSAAGSLGEASPVNIDPLGTSQDPDVAMLDDGRLLVTWAGPECEAGGACDVFFQRFGADGRRGDPNDQRTPIHATKDGKQMRPAAASGPNFFVVAWEDVDRATIAARFVGGSDGFLYNSVTGQRDDFVASRTSLPGVRRSPAVAVGAAGVAIGWHDEDAARSGAYVRRFPFPRD